MRRAWSTLVLGMLAACGDDAPADDADASDGDVAVEEVADTTPAVVDTLPTDSEQLHARLKSWLVNGRTTVIVAPDADLKITFDYTVWSPASCADCSIQIVVATADATRVACHDIVAPGLYPGEKGSAEVHTTAISAPGTMSFRWKMEQLADCAAAIAAYPDAPAGEDSTLFEVLVQ